MSHEIRNPLNGVVGLCDILDEAPVGSVAPRERMLVRTLKGGAGQLRSMLDDVLDFSRIDRGEIQLHEEDFESAVRAGAHGDVNRLVDSVGAMVDGIATTARARAMETGDDV